MEVFSRKEIDVLLKIFLNEPGWCILWIKPIHSKRLRRCQNGKPTSKKAKAIPSTENVMGTKFWNSRGINNFHLLFTTRKNYNSQILYEIRSKEPHFTQKKVLLRLRTIHQHTNRHLPWKNYSNCDSSCFLA